MTGQLQTLFRYRQLITTLTARDLKARYRGSVLGFFWSLANPLLLLAVYTLVFTKFFKKPDIDAFPLFIFSGILPWTFFAGSVLESTNAIVSNGGLIKKVMFPAEALPMVVVLSNLVHFVLALPILLAASLIASFGLNLHIGWALLVVPLLLVLQAVFVAGIALAVSSASVLFRDLRDLVMNMLQLGFFMTPVIYLLDSIRSRPMRVLLRLNPMTPFVRSYQQVFWAAHFPGALDFVLMTTYALLSITMGAIVFNRLRDSLAEAI